MHFSGLCTTQDALDPHSPSIGTFDIPASIISTLTLIFSIIFLTVLLPGFLTGNVANSYSAASWVWAGEDLSIADSPDQGPGSQQHWAYLSLWESLALREAIFFSGSEFSQKRFLKQHPKSLSQKPHLKTEALLLACRLLATQWGKR